MSIKQTIKIIACSLFYYSGLFHLYIVYILKRRKTFPAVIINYHRFAASYDGVIDIEPAFRHLINDFKKELNFLQRYFDIVSLDTIVEKLKKQEVFRRPTVAITIDDGYQDNFEVLLPVLKQENIPVTIFLTAGIIGTNQMVWVDKVADILSNPKKESLASLKVKQHTYTALLEEMKEMALEERGKKLSQLEEEFGKVEASAPIMLDWEQVRAMQEYNISFGAHTCTHPILTKMPLEDAKREIADSKKLIEERLGIKVKHFAYPNGRLQDFSAELRAYCKQIGFESVSGYENNGGNLHTDDVFALKRLAAYRPISVFAVNVMKNLLFQRK